ncbi:MAG: twin-arginine translocation signal domain-containing protein [Candidatus Aminicenantes bacterium]|nr:twin-arginine translocation signal domain-containing protein [Candidatus Aminicenantes bacterium]NLH75446.1 twin-arginine translocation signal domain-containing protein [Acidobacteriota bacterium]
MSDVKTAPALEKAPRCCPCQDPHGPNGSAFTRRDFLKGAGVAALGSVAAGGLTWPLLAARATPVETVWRPVPLKVKPILSHEVPTRRHQTSWRSWGGIATEADARAEAGRIRDELAALARKAEFPVEILPVSAVRRAADVAALNDIAGADVLLVYAAGGWMDVFEALDKTGKDRIFFCRHKSGPVYLWYEIISPRYLRQHTDTLAVKGVDEDDVVIDSQDELLWRLRALAGLRNTLGTRILAVGGPDAWAQPAGVVPELVADKWKFDIVTVPYEDLGRLIKEARADAAAVRRAKGRADAYLRQAGTTLETGRPFVENGLLLDEVFRALLKEAGCRALTINGCMGTIMPLAETSACLTLSTLNDDGYLAFCESDFVVIPSGVLLANIAARPVFLNDPTYPHDGIITLAHCTAPRKLDGKTVEPARLLTHFESDYGAAPKVEMRQGQLMTHIAPDFASKRWVGLLGEIAEVPFLPICRSQIDVRYRCDDRTLAKRMPGFHWMSAYGDFSRELPYALRRVGIEWDFLG